MAEQSPQGHSNNAASPVSPAETKEHGCFDVMRKKEEKAPEDFVMADLNAAKEREEEEKHTLMDELQHTHSHSCSSSEEEVEGGERKKKKKRGLKETNNEKVSGDKGEETKLKDTCIPMEKCNEKENANTVYQEEKKGFLEKIKEKLPGQHKKIEDDTQTTPACELSPGSGTKEKKGLIDKIKEKLPGHHKSHENESKED